MPKATSKAQQRFFGAIASGSITRKGLSKAEARSRLQSGKSYKKLPARKKKKK